MTHSTLLDRFRRDGGGRLLVECLCTQGIIGRDETIANLLADNAELRELAAGELLIRQGDADNDIYFVLAGKLRIFVNEREVASRGSGHHVGEMAFINPALRRTATNIAAETTVVAKISEAAFSKIADAYPRLWRGIGIELTNRLHQRGAFLSEPNTVPILFLGSSSESLVIAEALAAAIPSDVGTVRLWSQGVFGASHFPIEDLEVQVRIADFAVLVAAADDLVTSRCTDSDAPRDNVIFELGLFMGQLSRQRTFILAPQGASLKIPTDLLGLHRLQYLASAPNARDAVANAAGELLTTIKAMGSR